MAALGKLGKIRAQAGPYPTEKLVGCNSALLLFGAGFLGTNDGIHMLDAEIHAAVVDTDAEKLFEMRMAYPVTWRFYAEDAWAFVERQFLVGYDVVSVDCWTGDLEKRVLDSMPLWCSLARKLVTITIGYGTIFTVPDGWKYDILPRGPKARWLILEHAHS